MNKMTYGEANVLIREKAVPAMTRRFEEVYPDAFVKCQTRDIEVHRTANGCMYQWYLEAVNAVLKLNFSPKYSQTREETIEGDWSCASRFYEDMLNTPDFPKFLIENVKI